MFGKTTKMLLESRLTKIFGKTTTIFLKAVWPKVLPYNKIAPPCIFLEIALPADRLCGRSSVQKSVGSNPARIFQKKILNINKRTDSSYIYEVKLCLQIK
jgi:hypothetical protein